MKAKVSTKAVKGIGGAALRLAKPGEAPEACAPLKPGTAKPSATEMAFTEAAVAKSMLHTEQIAPGNKLAYNVKEAAEALGVSPWYVRDEMNLGRLGFSSARGRKIIPRWELVRYLEEYMQGHSEAAGDEENTLPMTNDAGAPSQKKALTGSRK